MIALVQGIVDDVNRERSRYEQIKKFVILPRDFTMEQDEVTPTLKLKRRAIMKNFADAVDGLYATPRTGVDGRRRRGEWRADASGSSRCGGRRRSRRGRSGSRS